MTEPPGVRVMKPGAACLAGMALATKAAIAAKEEKKLEKTVFELKLESYEAASKIKLIKEVRSCTNLGLKEAKDLIEKTPSILGSIPHPRPFAAIYRCLLPPVIVQAPPPSHSLLYFKPQSISGTPPPLQAPPPSHSPTVTSSLTVALPYRHKLPHRVNHLVVSAALCFSDDDPDDDKATIVWVRYSDTRLAWARLTFTAIGCGGGKSKNPTKIDNYGIWLRYHSRTGYHNMYKEFCDTTLNGAVEQMYNEMASRHRVRFLCSQIIKAATVPAKLCKRESTKQFHNSKISFH
ncbi:60S ribosomal protein L18a [Morus notabilis]|uniref:60S ribosomal protein L18a n=1 Tax=Morus notabilis TaxID=981085 RepID=W9QC04_9ROSA|nr:60S ribosomal protein L18a [Morus notabilis]